MMNRLSKPDFGREEAIALQKALESGWVGPNGPEVRAFENEMEQYLGGDVSVLATNSGTSALHLSLLALGVGPGDLVLVQSYGYCSAAFAVSYVGAKPVFIDSEIDTWGMDPNQLEGALLSLNKEGLISKIKAIIVVHVFGTSVQLGAIQALATNYGIPLIEDAAEGIGSSYKGKALGTLANFGVLSFNANKVLSAGGGGALICKSHEHFAIAKQLANQAKIPGRTYHHSGVGYNYLMNDLTAALARVQLRRLNYLLQQRAAINGHYRSELDSQFDFQKQVNDCDSNYWLSAILVPFLMNESVDLTTKTVEFKRGFQPMHLYPVYQNCRSFGVEVSESLYRQVLCLPSGSDVDYQEVLRQFKLLYLK